MADQKKLSTAEVQNIAKLARLALAQEEIEKMKTDLSAVLEYVSKLQALDTAKVQPTHHATGTKNVWREDKATRDDDHHDKFAKNAPKLDGRHLKVQAILEDNE